MHKNMTVLSNLKTSFVDDVKSFPTKKQKLVIVTQDSEIYLTYYQTSVLEMIQRGDPVFKENLHVKFHKDFPKSDLDETLGGSCTKVYEDNREGTSQSYSTRSKVKPLLGLVHHSRGPMNRFPCKT